MRGDETFIPIGQIVRPHGLGGALKVVSLTDYPEFFKKIQSLYMEGDGGCGVWVEVEKGNVQGNHIILKLKGIDDRIAAEALRGFFLKVRREIYPDLPAGREYVFDLIGLEVKTLDNQRVGHVVDVMQLPGQEVYVVDTGKKEILIPGVEEFIKKIDVSEKVILVQLLEGLCD